MRVVRQVISFPFSLPDFCAQATKNASIMATQAATIREIVTADYRAAKVLEAYGIDFCFSGKKTLREVSEEQHLSNSVLEKALANLKLQPNGSPIHWNFSEWETRFLVEYIIHTHHSYIRKVMPELLRLGERLSSMEGVQFPEIAEIYQKIVKLASHTHQHLTSEEYALFPYILEMETVRDSKLPFVAPEFGRVEKPVQAIETEHMLCAGLLREIRALSGEFTPPHGSSQEQRTWYTMLKELDADMHLHIHLESNILFPRALALEAELLQRKGFTSIWFG
ncbi:MAG: hypothetical protein DYG98_25065 [Haliscomenobacteraceae bacterium CHB4]|nr:Iron-sulfur cluster repair protein YtfE [Saprospiraceae bacterium]MCE7926328.1 hypothetical protein [Haliscomenobacteraceae bacterium CHB4]